MSEFKAYFYGGRHVSMTAVPATLQTVILLPGYRYCPACLGTCISSGTQCVNCHGRGQISIEIESFLKFQEAHEKHIPEHVLKAIPILIVVPNAGDMQYVTQAIGVPITPFNELNELLNEKKKSQSKEITTIAIECWPEDISFREVRLLMRDVQKLVYTSRSLYIKLYIIVSSIRNVHPGIRKSCRLAEFRRKIDN